MKNNISGQTPLFIKELIRRVHQELVESREEREAAGEPAIFQVSELTIEVNFVVAQSTEAKGGLDFKIITVGGIELGGSKEYQQQQVHKIILSLTALPDAGLSVLTDLEESASTFRPRED